MTRYVLGCVLALAVVLTGCFEGGGDDSGSSGSAEIPEFAKGFVPPNSGCGTFDTPAPDDPQGVLKDLDAEHQESYSGYLDFINSGDAAILRSNWADWKPDHPGPYDVAILWGPLTTDWQVQLTDSLQQFLEESPEIGDVSFDTVGSAYDVGIQLQLYDSIVRKSPDVIIVQPLTIESLKGPIDQAAALGIPTVTVPGYAVTPNQVAVDTNAYLASGNLASYASRVLEGKGNVVYVEGIAGSAVDAPSQAAWDAVIGSCPDMHASEDIIYAVFAQATAKQEMIKYLGTHPEPVDAVFSTAVMETGIMRAFDLSGRPMPVVPAAGLMKGALGYWLENDAEYDNAGATILPVPAARAVAEVSLRMLDGQGVKLNTLVAQSPLVTDANLSEWAESDWSLSTTGGVGGAEDSFMPSDYIDDFFAHPAPVD